MTMIQYFSKYKKIAQREGIEVWSTPVQNQCGVFNRKNETMKFVAKFFPNKRSALSFFQELFTK